MISRMDAHTVLSFLEKPADAECLSDLQWQDLIRILRCNDLTATLASLLEKNNIVVQSAYGKKHLASALVYAKRQSQQVEYESRHLRDILSEIGVVPMFLKGAAYALANDLNADGRLMSDIDILVTHSQLELVEKQLKANGWKEKVLDSYDENYYRQWSHELPPFINSSTGTTLDIHHTLIPPITSKSVPVDSVFSNSVQGRTYALLPSMEWRLLHCIIHFFYNEDYEKPIRDMWDLRCLFLQLRDRQHLEQFLTLASSIGFRKEAGYALRTVEYVFNDITEHFGAKVDSHLTVSETVFCGAVIKTIAKPRHAEIDSLATKFCCFIMMMRGHVKKMPMNILIPHIAVKLYRGFIKTVYGRYHFD